MLVTGKNTTGKSTRNAVVLLGRAGIVNRSAARKVRFPLASYLVCPPPNTLRTVTKRLVPENGLPSLVWVEQLHLVEFVESGRPKILLIDNTVVADDKGHNASLAVLGRRCD